MKRLITLLAAASVVSHAVAQETEHFIVSLVPTNDPGFIIGRGNLSLTGGSLDFYFTIHQGYSGLLLSGTINGPADGGSAGPVYSQFYTPGCGPDVVFCVFSGQTNLSVEQVAILRSGRAQALFNKLIAVSNGVPVLSQGFVRGQIVPDLVCEVAETNSINFAATLLGPDPSDPSRTVHWGEAAFALSGTALRYQIEMVSDFGPYSGLIFPGPEFLTYEIGPLDCAAAVTNSPPAGVDFDSRPRCVARGVVCVPDGWISNLVGGRWTIVIDLPSGLGIRGTMLRVVDSDGDGVPDYRDQCPNTPPDAVVNGEGCSISQLCPCEGRWRNHGDYIRCVIAHAWQFYRAGLFSSRQRQTVIRHAARSHCGMQRNETEPIHIHVQPQSPLEIKRDGLRFFLSGDISGGCVLEGSSDLRHWVPIQTNEVTGAGMEVVTRDSDQTPLRFYRVRLLP